MVIKKAEYVISSPSLAQCPKPDKAEYAFSAGAMWANRP